MAICQFSISVLSRGKGAGSAVAAAAYRHNTRMKSEYDGNTYNYSTKDDLVHSEISLPENAPAWAREAFGDVALGRELDGREGSDGVRAEAVAKLSQKLWNGVEQYEASHNRRHAEARLARKFTIALPVELTREDQIIAMREYVQKAFTERGMVADWVHHDPKGKKHDNPHAHITVSTRKLGEENWGLKNRDWNARDLVMTWRSEWAEVANIALERAGFDERIDHRSYADQGIELEPVSFNPHVAEHAEAAGQVARNKERAEQSRAKNEAFLRANPEHILVVVGAERSVFDREDIEAAFEKRLGEDAPGLSDLVEIAMASPNIVQAVDGGFTTKAQASVETNLQVDALQLYSERLVISGGDGLPVGAGKGMEDDQIEALKEMVSDRRLSLITGYAGAGKTWTIGEAAKVWEARGYEVLGGAVSGKATAELADIEELRAASLAALEARWSRGKLPSQGKFVFFMDEAGMVGSSHWERVQRKVTEMGGKLIAVGDPEQFQPVLDTGAFGMVMKHVPYKVINSVMRMENWQERLATTQFAQGEDGAKSALQYYDGAGHIKHDSSGVADIANDYYKVDPKASRVAIAYSNRDVWELNSAIRDQALELGLMDVRGQVNYGVIRRVDRSGLHPKIVTVPMEFAQNDRVLFTKPHRELNLPKSTFATVLETRKGEIDLLIDGKQGRKVTVDMSAFSHFDYGYAATGHRLQGVSMQYVFALAHARMNRHAAYVFMSRHVKAVTMYVVPERFKNIDFEDAMTQSGYLNATGDLADARNLVQSSPSVAGMEIVQREDYAPDTAIVRGGALLEDAHLTSVFRHHYGLIASEYVKTETPMFGDDPSGFIENPQGVIDHLIKHSSTFHASDVAGALMEVVFEPDSFARLFEEAMSHPDLVILSENGQNGEGRVYSTGAQVKVELEAVDLGVALAKGSQDQQLEAGAGYVASVLANETIDASVADAVQYGTTGGQVRLISGGSGSGKSTALGLIGQAHEYAGFDVVSVAPTRATAKSFGLQAGVTAQTFGSLVYGLDHGTKHLDANSVIVLDHAELMGAEDALQLLKLVEHTGAKLVAARGEGALTSIAAGQVFADIEERVGAFELSGSLRQADMATRDIVSGLKTKVGRARDVGLVDEMISGGFVSAQGNRLDAIDMVARAYVLDPNPDKVAIGYSRADVDALNVAIHVQMQPGTVVGPNGPLDPSVVNLETAHVGDKFVLLERYAPVGLAAGEKATVVDADKTHVTLRLGDLKEERFLKVARNDAEMNLGHGFAQTLYSAYGSGHSSVHVLGSAGFTRDALHAAAGLHEDKLSLVLPFDEDGSRDYLEGVLNKEARVVTVSDYVTDADRILGQISERATALSQSERGADNIYGKPEEVALTPDQSVTAQYLKDNPEHILTLMGAERSQFSQSDLEGAFEKRLQEGSADIQVLMDKVMAHPALVALDDFGRGGHRLYTTRANVVQEMNLMEQVRDHSDRAFADVSGFGAYDLPVFFADEQKHAVEAMVSDAPITLVKGYSGAGKTTAIRAAAKVWKDRGFDVYGGALSGNITQGLASVEGIERASLAAWEARWARGRRPESGKFVMFMDEAAMVGPDVWARVQDRVLKMGGKLIAVGDPEQLQPVSQASAYKSIEAEIGSEIIAEVRRQKDTDEQKFTKQFTLGGKEAVEALHGYADRGAVVFLEDEAACIAAISKDYADRGAAGESKTVMAYTNRDVNVLNDQIHSDRVESGAVNPDTVQDYGLIERVDRSTGAPRRTTLALHLGEGDRVIFKQAHADLRIPKSAFADVVATRTGEVDLLIDGDVPRQVTIDMTSFNQFDYGYAATIHKLQGASKAHSATLAHPYMDKHSTLVAMSRHELSTKLYVPRTRIENMEGLERIVQRSSYQPLAERAIEGRVQESFVPGLTGAGIEGRTDLVRDTQTDHTITFEGDAHLASVANRMTGLLASNYREGDPIFLEDPKGYIEDPEKIIDDMIQHQSTLRATDVARTLSGVVKHPDHYARLFREAMSHPDLVVLSEEGDQGEGRIYSTKAQVALELDVVDRGARLALLRGTNQPEISDWLVRNIKKKHTLSDEQASALKLSSKDPFTIISGSSGSGKTHLAAAIGDAHAHAGRQVILVSPTGIGADNLREANGKAPVMTLMGLDYAIKEKRITLDANTVIVLDEAGLVGAKTADGLFKKIEDSSARLVALRHNDQMGPYEAAPVFQTLEARIGGIELGMQHRSQNVELSHVLGGINAAGVDASVTAKALNELGVITSGGTRDASIQKIAQNYVLDPNPNKMIVAHSRADVASANKAVRSSMDTRSPERMEGRSQHAEAGSIADLRLGDRIVLSSYYKAARLRPGTRLEVVRTNEQDVVLKLGSGAEAEFIKLDKEDAEFDYKFGFATTLLGSKGRAIESVYMLATPGMSRNDFNTGAGLHGQSLNVVLPTSEEHKEAAVTAILQTDGTARSTLDYGFSADNHVREALKDHTPEASHDIGILTAGMNRILDWVADRIDGGAGATPTRAKQLRAKVVGELLSARSRTGLGDVTMMQRKDLETFVDHLIKKDSWRKTMFQFGGVKSRTTTGSIVEGSMVGRILLRGEELAKAHKNDGLQDWFVAARSQVNERMMDRLKAPSLEKDVGVDKGPVTVDEVTDNTFKHDADTYLGRVERKAAAQKAAAVLKQDKELQQDKSVEQPMTKDDEKNQSKFKYDANSYLGRVERKAAAQRQRDGVKQEKAPVQDKSIDRSISKDDDGTGFGY